MQQTIEVVKNRITPANHEFLSQESSDIEVFEAIKQMKSTAAPGLNALFYQSYWHIIGSDITNYVLNILNQKGDPSNIN